MATGVSQVEYLTSSMDAIVHHGVIEWLVLTHHKLAGLLGCYTSQECAHIMQLRSSKSQKFLEVLVIHAIVWTKQICYLFRFFSELDKLLICFCHIMTDRWIG